MMILYDILVGDAITIFKNDGVRQWEGWHPIYEMENKSHVPNHQPGNVGEKNDETWSGTACVPPLKHPKMYLVLRSHSCLHPSDGVRNNSCHRIHGTVIYLGAKFEGVSSWLSNPCLQHLQAQASYTRIQKQVEGNEVAFPGKSCKHVESLCGHPGIGFGGTFQNMSNHVGIVEGYLQGLDKKASNYRSGNLCFKVHHIMVSYTYGENNPNMIHIYFISWYHMVSKYGLFVKTITFLSKPQSKLFNNRFHLDLRACRATFRGSGCWLLHFTGCQSL